MKNEYGCEVGTLVEDTEEDLVDLGRASEETKGGLFGWPDGGTGWFMVL